MKQVHLCQYLNALAVLTCIIPTYLKIMLWFVAQCLHQAVFLCLYSVHSLCIYIGLYSVVSFINNSFLKLYIAENVFPYESRAPQLIFILLLRELNCTASHASSDRNSWLVIFISKIDNI